MRIDTIALDNVLPDVFASAAGDASVLDSDVWLSALHSIARGYIA